VFQFLELCFACINTENDLLISFWAAFLSFGPAVVSEAISTVVLSLLAGAVVGFSLGLIGGGGSILAVPLLIYVVGVANTHVAIGTSALAVGVNALINMIHHKKAGHVRVKEGVVFAIPGAVGTIIGAQLGLLTSSEDLLILFAVFMTILSLFMLLKSRAGSNNDKKQEEKGLLSHHHPENSGLDKTNNDFEDRIEEDKNYNESHNSETSASKHFLTSILQDKKFYRLLIVGFVVGIGAGYFGIGGGFIIVPALMHTIPGLTIIDAVGTSLISVSTFGFLTATRYSLNGEINWFIALLFIAGGVVGGFYGTRMSSKISKERLQKIFAIVLFVVGVYMILMSITNA
jgi:uncharacterized membrane protein YfcA